MTFEYTTSYVELDYKRERSGVWIFKTDLPLTEPDISSTGDWQKQLNKMGGAGWELVSAQPLLRGVYQIPESTQAGGGAISYPITAGFCLFWKRPKEAAN
ncbi:DUF4177 domain-containing protein [Pseudomonas sp. NCHU5208]|uniref:DUF4177 domain-containing protein n=1 Tax=unclassified Pseudomonas TaxID=196821 RepID=UPI003F951A55